MSSINPKEIDNFQKDSAHWWDINGPFKPLHKLNPVRLDYFKSQICSHFGRNIDGFDSYKALSILDVGCGGGLVCEPMARLGGKVTGLDADKTAINVATHHAAESDLNIDYKCMSAEDLAKTGQQFDVVLALEIIEHVNDPASFVQTIAKLCKPGGLIIFSTLNRNPKSFALGIIAAEYILGWVPKGTHNWKKFIKPSELSRWLRQNSATPKDLFGLAFNPIKNDFHLAPKDVDVNYFLTSINSSSS